MMTAILLGIIALIFTVAFIVTLVMYNDWYYRCDEDVLCTCWMTSFVLGCIALVAHIVISSLYIACISPHENMVKQQEQMITINRMKNDTVSLLIRWETAETSPIYDKTSVLKDINDHDREIDAYVSQHNINYIVSKDIWRNFTVMAYEGTEEFHSIVLDLNNYKLLDKLNIE